MCTIRDHSQMASSKNWSAATRAELCCFSKQQFPHYTLAVLHAIYEKSCRCPIPIDVRLLYPPNTIISAFRSTCTLMY